jgi:hypothetical protein
VLWGGVVCGFGGDICAKSGHELVPKSGQKGGIGVYRVCNYVLHLAVVLVCLSIMCVCVCGCV